MPKIMKPLRIAIDLQSLVGKKILHSHNNLLNHNSYKGALGAVTAFSEVFDLYLINKYTSINSDEVERWLKAADIVYCFRQIVPFDESIRDFYQQKTINVTIASDRQIIEEVKELSKTFWIMPVHVKDIQVGITKTWNWNDILREISKFASVENYELSTNKRKLH